MIRTFQSMLNKYNGIFLLDKSSGITSNLALQKIKRLFQTKKAGHTGSLDPLATGMLPICLGEATKFSAYLLDADKTYSVTMKLGERTNTSDSDGEVIVTRTVSDFSLEHIRTTLNTFLGKTLQIPTMFSAIKYQGKPLYAYARQGITVARTPRPITLYSIDDIVFEKPFVQCTVRCSKGTYIRTFVDDVGEKLGCGAHVTALRRLSVAGFTADQMTTLEVILQQEDKVKFLLPIDSMVKDLPKIILSSHDALALWHGKIVSIPEKTVIGFVRVYTQEKSFIGVGKIEKKGELKAGRLIRMTAAV